MTDEGYIPDNSPVKKTAPYIIAATALACFFITIFCLLEDINIIYPHLYYIPIILTALFYPKKGTAFAALIGVIYIFTTFVITEGNPSIIVENLIRVIVFIGIAAVVSAIAFLLREDNLKYKNLMDSSGAASAVLDNKGRIIHVNATFESITGYSLKELKRENWVSIFANEYRGIALMLYKDSIEGKRASRYNEDLIVKSKTGNESYVLATIKHIPELEITLISLVDITEKKKIEKIVAVQKERYKKLFQQSIDGIVIHNSEGRIFNANSEALKIFGMNLRDLKNTSLLSIIPEEFHERFKNAINNEIKKGQTYGIEAWIEPERRDHIDLEIRSTIVDEKTNVILSIIRDITTRKKNEKALEMASKKLNLLSSITRHDILNHIMVARINLEFALEDEKDEDVKEFISKSTTAIDTIQRQIEFSRDYQDMGGNPPKWHNLEEIVGSGTKSQHLPPGITVLKKIKGVKIFADPMLEKVISNLIGNTIMHGGDVSTISISIEEGEQNYHLIYEDNGKGIPEKDKMKIFRPGFGRNQGFGLYLVAEILSITGASITEKGSENKGVRFEMLFPKQDVRFSD